MRYPKIIINNLRFKVTEDMKERQKQGSMESKATGNYWTMLDKITDKVRQLVKSGEFKMFDSVVELAVQEQGNKLSEDLHKLFILSNAPMKVFFCEYLKDCGEDLKTAIKGRVHSVEAYVACQKCPNKGRGARACYGCDYRYIPHDSVKDIPRVIVYEAAFDEVHEFKNMDQYYEKLNESAIKRMYADNKLDRYNMVYKAYTTPTPWLGVNNLTSLVLYWFDGSREKFVEYAKLVVDSIKEQGNWDVDFDTHARKVVDGTGFSTYVETRAENRAGVSTLGEKGRRVTHVYSQPTAREFIDKHYEEDVVNEFLSLTYYVAVGILPQKKCANVTMNHTSFLIPVYQTEEAIHEFNSFYRESLRTRSDLFKSIKCANYEVIPEDDERDWDNDITATPVYVDPNEGYTNIKSLDGAFYELPCIDIEFVNMRAEMSKKNK